MVFLGDDPGCTVRRCVDPPGEFRRCASGSAQLILEDGTGMNDSHEHGMFPYHWRSSMMSTPDGPGWPSGHSKHGLHCRSIRMENRSALSPCQDFRSGLPADCPAKPVGSPGPVRHSRLPLRASRPCFDDIRQAYGIRSFERHLTSQKSDGISRMSSSARSSMRCEVRSLVRACFSSAICALRPCGAPACR